MEFSIGSSDPALRPCPVCGANDRGTRMVLGHLPSKYGPQTYELGLCLQCELIVQSPLPSDDEFRAMYVDGMQFHLPAYQGERAKGAQQFYTNRMQALLDGIGKTPDTPVGVLEIGGGLSWLAHAAKTLCPQSRTVAQDVSPEAQQQCPWVDHYLVGELEAFLPSLRQLGPFDVISLTHVIEHLPDPMRTLGICRELLSPQGVVFITAPHRPVGWTPAGPFSVWADWGYSHVPMHLQYFNERNIRQAANQAGLAVAHYTTKAEAGQALEAWLRR